MKEENNSSRRNFLSKGLRLGVATIAGGAVDRQFHGASLGGAEAEPDLTRRSAKKQTSSSSSAPSFQVWVW